MTDITQAILYINKTTNNLKPVLAMSLGSGHTDIVNLIQDATVIPYNDIPGFADCTVAGHGGKLVIGTINGTAVACLQGRLHYYEGVDHQTMAHVVRTLHALGCRHWLATNASGGLNPNQKAGEFMMVNDHINFQGRNPLLGVNDPDFGPRFPSLEGCYTKSYRELLLSIAKEKNIRASEGVYIGVLGPSYETPAEIRMFQAWGADAIGMSTIPEVILAAHCGMKIAVIAAVTNMAVGLTDETLTHESVLQESNKTMDDLVTLINEFIRQCDFT